MNLTIWNKSASHGSPQIVCTTVNHSAETISFLLRLIAYNTKFLITFSRGYFISQVAVRWHPVRVLNHSSFEEK